MRPDLLLAKTKPEFLTTEVEDQFKQYAVEQYPKEACAYVINGDLIPVANISMNPTKEFELSPDDALIMAVAQGFMHSHPDGDRWPSALDMQTQIQWGKPFGIITCTDDSASESVWWGDHTLTLPLEERPFIHAITDCYSLIRAEKYQRDGIILKDYPRNFEWWEDGSGDNFYDQYFEDAGYELVSNKDELQVGDVIFMKIHTTVVSHAAVYVGNGLILHHLRDRFSRIEHASSWKKFTEKVVRYKG